MSSLPTFESIPAIVFSDALQSEFAQLDQLLTEGEQNCENEHLQLLETKQMLKTRALQAVEALFEAEDE
jgi:hypothetical protein